MRSEPNENCHTIEIEISGAERSQVLLWRLLLLTLWLDYMT